MKKTFLIVIALALVLTLALTLAACGGSTEQTPQGGTPSTPDSGGQTPETPDGGGQTPETPDEGDEGETPVPPVTYTVTFETNGGSAVQPVTVDEGDAVAAAPETTLEGYEFGGWYSSSDLSDDSLVTFPYTPADNITLYAKWSKILTAADLYNEVFGEDYAFVSFEEALQIIPSKITTVSYEFIVGGISETDFIFYVNVYRSGRYHLGKVTYLGSELSKWNEYYEFSKTLESADFCESILNNLPNTVLLNSAEYDAALEKLTQLRAKVDSFNNLIETVSRYNFSILTPSHNTTTEIEFADFAAKFMPAGVTPIACYVGDLHAPVPGHFVGDYPYGGTIQLTLCYKDTSGTIFVVDTNYYVGANSGSEETMKIYTRFLEGEIEHDFRIYSQETTTIENPIWTGYTVGVTK